MISAATNGKAANNTQQTFEPSPVAMAHRRSLSGSGGGGGASRSSRDRTHEFLTAVRSMQGRQMANGSALGGQKPAAHAHDALLATRQSSEFMKIARAIGRDIASTFTKLEKLTLLARQKSIFDDRPAEIAELTHIIKEDMNALNRQIAQLQTIAQSPRQGQGKHQQSHTSNVVVALQSKLASMTTDFTGVLEERTENLKESKSRQEQYSAAGTGVTASMPQSALRGFQRNGVDGSVLAMEDDLQSQPPGHMSELESRAMQMYAPREHEYLQDRANTMQNIESTIIELGGIFSQLATMIKEQDESILRIDHHTEQAAENVIAGHGEILKYFQNVTSNRWLMVKIFGVLIFFFIFFVIFMA